MQFIKCTKVTYRVLRSKVGGPVYMVRDVDVVVRTKK